MQVSIISKSVFFNHLRDVLNPGARLCVQDVEMNFTFIIFKIRTVQVKWILLLLLVLAIVIILYIIFLIVLARGLVVL